MLGIENLKKAIHLAISLPIQVIESSKKKIKFLAILNFIDEFKELTQLVKERDKVVAEIKDLSPEERTELLEYIKSEFDIPDDKLESFIENAITWAFSFITLVDEAKELKK